MQHRNPAEFIRETASAYRQSRIFLTAFELKIFTAIANGSNTSEEIAEAIGADARTTDRLLNALVILGFLDKEKGEFFNKEDLASYLVEGKENFMANLYHSNHLWDSWSTLTEAVKQGGAVKSGETKDNDDWRESFIAAMHHRAEGQADELAESLDLTNVYKVLDIGGGSGVFSMGVVKRKPEVEAVVFDLPEVTPITKRYIKDEGFEGSITTYDGDLHTEDFPKGFDLIIISAIVHMNSYQENKEMIAKAYDSLNNGGQIVIKDFIMEDNRIEPPEGAMFAINMLVNTEGGDSYTEQEIREWFENAGIKKIERKGSNFGGDLMIGYKE
jgi:DNA-binding MarR family transcriptional regulator/SAM-dependent methyltransferase